MASLARLKNDLRVAMHKKNTQAAEAIIKEACEGSTYSSEDILRKSIFDDILLTLLQHEEDPKFILKMVAYYIHPHADLITLNSMGWLTERQFDNDGQFLDTIIPVIGFGCNYLDKILRKFPISEDNFLSLLKMNYTSAPALACAAVFSRHPSNVNLAHVVLKKFPEKRDDILVHLRTEMKERLIPRDYYHDGFKRPLGLSSAAEQFCRVVLGEVIDRTSFLEFAQAIYDRNFHLASYIVENNKDINKDDIGFLMSMASEHYNYELCIWLAKLNRCYYKNMFGYLFTNACERKNFWAAGEMWRLGVEWNDGQKNKLELLLHSQPELRPQIENITGKLKF
jgi:hypothetical protein